MNSLGLEHPDLGCVDAHAALRPAPCKDPSNSASKSRTISWSKRAAIGSVNQRQRRDQQEHAPDDAAADAVQFERIEFIVSWSLSADTGFCSIGCPLNALGRPSGP